MDHVTAEFAELATLAVNCSVAPDVLSDGAEGVTLTATGGRSVIVAEPIVEPSVCAVAVTVTVCCVEMVAGAVYKPPVVSVPGEPEGIDQFADGALQLAITAN